MDTSVNTNYLNKFNAGSSPSVSEITEPVQTPPATKAVPSTKMDSVEFSEGEKKPKKGIITRFKDFIRTIKKFNTTVGGYTKATFDSAKNATITGALLYTGVKVVDFFKTRAARKAGKDIIKSMKKMPIVAGILGAISAIGLTFWKASLNVNKDRAEIDHSWTNTPINNN